MKIGEVFPTGVDQGMPEIYDFTKLPIRVLDWMGKHMQDSFVVWNETDRICFVTQSVKSLLGFSVDELIGNPWYEWLQPLEVELLQKYITSGRSDGLRVELLHKNKQPVYVELHVTKIHDDKTEEYFIACSLKDMSTFKKVKDLMIHAEKMSAIGQLTASIAHEIRNPLTAIKGFLQLLQAGVDYKDEYYRIMSDEIEKIEAVTSQLLQVSKPSTMNKKYIDVKQLITDIVILLQSEAKMKNITINIEEQLSAMIYCDSSQIKQVLINLVKNAIEAMDEPGEIIIYVTEDEEYTIINVKDEGVGIPQDLEHQLGVAFFTTKESGTGLGLNITKEILKQHGGFLNFMKNETKGSTFQLFFPKISRDGL